MPEVAARLGFSAHSLYKRVKAVSPDKSEQQSKELLEAKSEILRPAPPRLQSAQSLDAHRLITLKLDLRSHVSRKRPVKGTLRRIGVV